jgi:hypothetical protein
MPPLIRKRTDAKSSCIDNLHASDLQAAHGLRHMTLFVSNAQEMLRLWLGLGQVTRKHGGGHAGWIDNGQF